MTKRKISISFILILSAVNIFSQTLPFGSRNFEMCNVKASVINFAGENVLKVERDLNALPFDVTRMESTVDEPTFVKLADRNFKNGTIEVKVFSQIQSPKPFKDARGFIGVAYRIDDSNTFFESIYLRPSNGRSENQIRRNHTVQYYSYPDYKFDRLRKESESKFETYADIGLNEWITIRIEVENRKVVLYLNDQKNPAFIVEEMKGNAESGSVGLWVDIGTTGYFKDLKITKK